MTQKDEMIGRSGNDVAVPAEDEGRKRKRDQRFHLGAGEQHRGFLGDGLADSEASPETIEEIDSDGCDEIAPHSPFAKPEQMLRSRHAIKFVDRGVQEVEDEEGELIGMLRDRQLKAASAVVRKVRFTGLVNAQPMFRAPGLGLDGREGSHRFEY